MTGDKLNICISEEYAKTLGDLKSLSYQVESVYLYVTNLYLIPSLAD